ncbi:MAG: hypothetical protein GY953_57800, partial [bacterium]|nr:hypothetical protein [bacterium]
MRPFLYLFLSSSVLLGQQSVNAELLRKIELMEQRIRALETELAELKAEAEAAQGAPAPTLPPMAEVLPSEGTSSADFLDRETRMPVSGYMDFHLNKPSGEPAIADMHRFVLLFGHSFNDRIQFWAELELEHALVSSEEESGELELEQAYIDFRLKPWLSLRSGIVLTPVGLI